MSPRVEHTASMNTPEPGALVQFEDWARKAEQKWRNAQTTLLTGRCERIAEQLIFEHGAQDVPDCVEDGPANEAAVKDLAAEIEAAIWDRFTEWLEARRGS